MADGVGNGGEVGGGGSAPGHKLCLIVPFRDRFEELLGKHSNYYIAFSFIHIHTSLSNYYYSIRRRNRHSRTPESDHKQ